MNYSLLYLNRVVLFTCVLLCFSLVADAQLSGTVKNHSGKAIVGISVLLKHNNGQVLAYDYSNAEGKYILTIPDTAKRESLLIEVNWLGYKKIQTNLLPGIDVYPLVLEEAVIELKEVKVKSKPVIKSMGDTLRYDVSSFARKEDRNIGDVMSRLPGMSVDENGKISFNGKEVDNMLVGGDDLMDGRYGLATRTITKDMIKSIDVMTNHQPIRVLKNKVYSDKVVVNLVLKDENSFKLSGQAALGAGVPGRYEGEVNGMIFNKRFKMLNSLKTNNTGTDYKSDFQQLGNTADVNTVDATKPDGLLSEGIAGDPDIPRKNYYLNRSLVFNLNNLVNTNDTLQLKANVQLFFDRNQVNYISRSEFFLPSDTIHYFSSQQALRKPFVINTSLTAMVNKTTYFLNNSFRANISGSDNSSDLDFNGRSFSQKLTVRTYDFSNDLQYTPAIKGFNVGNIRWFTNVYSQPQQLLIGTGIDSAILNNNLSYAAVQQNAKIPSIVNQVSVYYALRNNGIFRQTYHASLLNEWQQLVSSINLTQHNGTRDDYKGDAGNALHWQRNKLYADGMFSIEKKNWRAELTLPVSVQNIRHYDEAYAFDEKRRYVFVNPSLSAKLYLNAEDYIHASWDFRNATGAIANVYRGVVLTNYLSLFANDASLQEKTAQTLSFQYNLRRTITMLFVNGGVSYSQSTVNSILSSVITNDVQRLVLLPYENRQNSISAMIGASKYIFELHTTASLRASWRRSRYNQFVNGQAFPFQNENMSLNISLQSKPLTNVTFNYNGTGSWSLSRPAAELKDNNIVNRVTRFDQQVLLGYSLGSLFLNTTGRHIYSERKGMDNINYLFLDANLRYRIGKWRTDVEFGVINLFNLQEYKTASVIANQYVFSSYAIRGRMAVLKATFNL